MLQAKRKWETQSAEAVAETTTDTQNQQEKRKTGISQLQASKKECRNFKYSMYLLCTVSYCTCKLASVVNAAIWLCFAIGIDYLMWDGEEWEKSAKLCWKMEEGGPHKVRIHTTQRCRSRKIESEQDNDIEI